MTNQYDLVKGRKLSEAFFVLIKGKIIILTSKIGLWKEISSWKVYHQGKIP